MSLRIYFLEPAEFSLYYNCSSYDVNSIPVEQRAHLFRGILFITLAVFLEVCYLPCMYAMACRRQRAEHCYRLMLFLGAIEMTALLIDGIIVGIWTLEGAVYCSRPAAIFWICKFGVFLYHMESVTLVILAINRCITIYDWNVADSFFKGPRLCVWISFPILYSCYTAWITNPIIFDAISTGLFLNPHLHYLPNNDYYHSILLDIHDYIVISLLLGIYFAFVVLFRRKFKNIYSTSVNGRQRKEFNTFIQIFLTCATFIMSIVGFIVEQYFTDQEWMVLMSTYGFVLLQGSPAIIYLCLNETIRREALQLIMPTKIAQGPNPWRSQAEPRYMTPT
ncbi:serpentine type 7TM GPCR chemoreceptor srt domain-containing protein [Ditylenchus destructor]|uniref:Serpentine type 7TM GPCR chemoreceptor srt domain-containing protein n=1 Tax=Ditylenchus destructor TaxID=166010 RepID=A0AAD4R023_9BILA|nr:serpentine type 7TM GPCR chemoreceptor srt domain-containing protein [Ditylenchus destructor]